MMVLEVVSTLVVLAILLVLLVVEPPESAQDYVPGPVTYTSTDLRTGVRQARLCIRDPRPWAEE